MSITKKSLVRSRHRNKAEKSWCHLFGETVGADIVREGNTIMSAFKVQSRLDLESYVTAFNYMRRYARDVIKKEENTTFSLSSLPI